MAERLHQGSIQEFDVHLARDVMVPMRDGVRLATDIYLPAIGGDPASGRFPCLIERTPYNKSASRFVINARFFARRGYAVAIQDVRGRGNSDGEWYPFAREAPDGFDTIEWAAAQSWCDGKAGTMGTSYMAAVQSAAATLNPPHLKAMFVTEGPSNYYHCSMRHNGAQELRFLIYAFHMAVTSKEARANPALRAALLDARGRIGSWLSKLPLKKGASPLRLIPTYEQWALDLQSHGDYDEYWRQRGYAISDYYAEHADVPTFYFGSWYDSYARATCENFAALSRLKKSFHKLMMGPWTHGIAMDQDFAGDAMFGPDAVESYNDLRLRWFDQWLKGLDTGIADEPPVTIFVMGGGSGRKTFEMDLMGRIGHGGRWRAEKEWPLARAKETRFHLHRGGVLAPEAPSTSQSSTTFRFDPRDPVPTVGGSISVGFELMPAGGFDQRANANALGLKDSLPLASRHDVVTFLTAPLDRDVEVTGPITFKLWAASSAPDTDFTVKLIDVYPPSLEYPDGYALNLTDSIIRARYRNSWTKPEPLVAGQPYLFTISMYPTSNRFARGNQIRVDVSSSNFPRFDVNSNTGGPLGEPGLHAIAENTIFHDATRPSHIVLPIVDE